MTSSDRYVNSVVAADLDGDGDQDVVSGGEGGLFWQENLDGHGTFGPSRFIAGIRASSLAQADLDGDGDPDLLCRSLTGAGDQFVMQTLWLDNADGRGGFGQPHVIATSPYYGGPAGASDLDGDGDLDVVFANYDNQAAWLENLDGAGTFGDPRPIGTAGGGIAVPADLDGDGDADILSLYGWIENVDHAQAFSPRAVPSDALHGARTVVAADVDGDADADLVAGSGIDGLVWYENLDGSGSFAASRRIAEGYRVSVSVGDLDGDGDVDVVSAGPVLLVEHGRHWQLRAGPPRRFRRHGAGGRPRRRR